MYLYEIYIIQVEKYNREHSEYFGNYNDLSYDDFGFFLVDENDCILGGLVGRIKLNWAQIDVLWVDENFRDQGYSSSLLNKLIDLAKEKNCMGLKTDTFDNSVKEFYMKKGFKLVGQIEDFPPGHTEYILCKKI